MFTTSIYIIHNTHTIHSARLTGTESWTWRHGLSTCNFVLYIHLSWFVYCVHDILRKTCIDYVQWNGNNRSSPCANRKRLSRLFLREWRGVLVYQIQFCTFKSWKDLNGDPLSWRNSGSCEDCVPAIVRKRAARGLERASGVAMAHHILHWQEHSEWRCW